VPIPRELALDERWRPTVPTLAWEGGAWDGGLGGSAGPRVGLGARGPVTGGTAEIGASLRATRGAAVVGRVALEDTGTADALLGWDLQRTALRGSLRTDLRSAVGSRRAALALDVASDPDIARDLDTGWTERARPWRESRALHATPSLRADAWFPDDGSAGWLARARVRRATGHGPVRGRAWVDAGLARSHHEDGAGTAPRALAGARVDADTTRTAVRVTATAVAETGRSMTEGEASTGDAALLGSASLPAWTPLGTGVLRLAPGVEAAGALGTRPRGGPTLAAAWEGPHARLDASARVPFAAAALPAPALQAQLVTSGDRSLRLAARWDPANRALDAAWSGHDVGAGLRVGRWSTFSTDASDAYLAAASDWLAWWAAGESRTLGSVEVDATPGRARAGMRAVFDLADTARIAGVEAHLGYDDGCVAAGVRASGGAATRGGAPVLDLALTLQVAPRVR